MAIEQTDRVAAYKQTIERIIEDVGASTGGQIKLQDKETFIDDLLKLREARFQLYRTKEDISNYQAKLFPLLNAFLQDSVKQLITDEDQAEGVQTPAQKLLSYQTASEEVIVELLRNLGIEDIGTRDFKDFIRNLKQFLSANEEI